jgi:hypothetical protein
LQLGKRGVYVASAPIKLWIQAMQGSDKSSGGGHIQTSAPRAMCDANFEPNRLFQMAS